MTDLDMELLGCDDAPAQPPGAPSHTSDPADDVSVVKRTCSMTEFAVATPPTVATRPASGVESGATASECSSPDSVHGSPAIGASARGAVKKRPLRSRRISGNGTVRRSTSEALLDAANLLRAYLDEKAKRAASRSEEHRSDERRSDSPAMADDQNRSQSRQLIPVPQDAQPQQAPDPKDPRVWCPCVEPAKVMRLLDKMGGTKQPVNTSCRVCVEIDAFALTGIVGAEEAEAILCACLAKPILAPHAYKQLLGPSTRSFNAVIVGPHGSGKRTAVKRACSLCGVTFLCIGPDTYEPWAITVATSYAASWRPTLIYFDGFDDMCSSNPEFFREFGAVVLQNRDLVDSWNYSWIVLGISNRATAPECVESSIVALCIPDNVASMRRPTGEELVRLAMTFLAEHRIPVFPDITPAQLEQLRVAVDGATPSDVHEFAMRVAASAMRNVDLKTLETIDAGSGVATIMGGGGGGGSRTRSPANAPAPQNSGRRFRPPSLGDLSGTVDSGGRTFDPGASSPGQVMRETGNRVPGIHIDWNRDAVSKYIRLDAVESADGLSKFVIPRKLTSGPPR